MGWDRHIYHVWKICLGLSIVADVIVVLLTFADAAGHWPFGHL